MIPTEDRIKIIKNDLAEFKKLAEPLLDLEVVYFDRPYHTLRIAVTHFEEALEVNWLDHNQAAVNLELASTFARVAHNLPPNVTNPYCQSTIGNRLGASVVCRRAIAIDSDGMASSVFRNSISC